MSLKKQFSKSAPKAKVTFTLPTEAVNGAKKVALVGEWNNWNEEKAVPMKKFKNEYKAVVELGTGRNWEFRYLIDADKWENDWAADNYVPNPFGFDNSVVSLPASPAPAKKAAAPKKATAKKTVVKKTVAKKAPAKKVVADDLKKIEGIGPKIAGLLNDAGIVTFADLGKATKKTLTTILSDAGNRYKMHDPTSWPRQAKLAAKGDWTELQKLQDKLVGGK